jgi:MoaA/NifB/PqqE/SkfB family radical SAM enzyme
MMKLSQMFKIASRLGKVKFLGEQALFKVTQHVTYRCNLDCGFCSRKNTAAEELSFSQIKSMMDEFKEIGSVVWVFNGGEPLMREDIGELISYAREIDFYTVLVTNGTLIPEKQKDIQKIDQFEVSLDGSPETNDSIRGKGAHARTLKGLEVLKKIGKKTTLNTVLNKQDISDIDKVIKTAEQYDFQVKFQPITTHPQDKDHKTLKYYPSKKHMQTLVDWIIEQKQKGRPIASSTAYLKKVRETWPGGKTNLGCYAGKTHISIQPDGSVTPCCGKLNDIEIHPDYSQKKPYSQALKKLPDLKSCQDCLYSFNTEVNLKLNIPR